MMNIFKTKIITAICFQNERCLHGFSIDPRYAFVCAKQKQIGLRIGANTQDKIIADHFFLPVIFERDGQVAIIAINSVVGSAPDAVFFVQEHATDLLLPKRRIINSDQSATLRKKRCREKN
jgi:hypothetical protein